MAEKLPIKKQIAAMEGWAIKAKQDIYSGEYKKAAESLKNLNFEGRRLEWRGEEFGLKDLPEMEEVKALKKEISSARASALEITSMFDKIESFKKKYPDQKEFERKAKSNLDLSKKYAISMLEMVVRARAVVEKEPWKPENFPLIKTEKWFASIFKQFAKRKGYYKNYPKDYSLHKIDLSGALLVKANLEAVDLRGASLFKANLQGASLREANLEEADLRGADLTGANLEFAELQWVKLGGANLSGADLTGANLSGAKLNAVNFIRAKLNGAKLREANLYGADLRKADLTGAKLTGANLQWANLDEADLSGADLREADLRKAQHQWVKLKGADLRGAHMF